MSVCEKPRVEWYAHQRHHVVPSESVSIIKNSKRIITKKTQGGGEKEDAGSEAGAKGGLNTSHIHPSFCIFGSAFPQCPRSAWGRQPLQNLPADTHSGGAHDGFSCPRQCRCAASRRDRIAPHSGQSTVERFGLALHDVALCRCWSCSRENVLSQYSHGKRFLGFDLERAAAARRRLLVARRFGVRVGAAGEDAEVDADAVEGEGEAGGGVGTRSGIGTGANVGVEADVDVDMDDKVGEAGGGAGAGAMARNLRLTYSSPSSKLSI